MATSSKKVMMETEMGQSAPLEDFTDCEKASSLSSTELQSSGADYEEDEFKPPRAYVRGGQQKDKYDFRDEYAPADESIDQPTYEFRKLSYNIRTSAPVHFDVLVEGMTSITEDGGVKKRVLVESSDSSAQIVDGCRVWVHYESYAEFPDLTYLCKCKGKVDRKNCTCVPNQFLDSTRLHDFATSLKIGEQGIYGLQLSIQSMKKMEIAEFIVDPMYAYGHLGVPGLINKNSRVRIIMQLMAVGRCKKLWEFLKPTEMETDGHNYTMEDRVQGAIRLIAAGEQKMLYSHFRDATDRFCIAMSILENDLSEEKQKEMDVVQLKYKIHAALADVYTRREMYEPAAQECDQALALGWCPTDESKLQIMKCHASALFQLGNYDESMTVVEQGLAACSIKDQPNFNRIKWKVLHATGKLPKGVVRQR